MESVCQEGVVKQSRSRIRWGRDSKEYDGSKQYRGLKKVQTVSGNEDSTPFNHATVSMQHGTLQCHVIYKYLLSISSITRTYSDTGYLLDTDNDHGHLIELKSTTYPVF